LHGLDVPKCKSGLVFPHSADLEESLISLFTNAQDKDPEIVKEWDAWPKKDNRNDVINCFRARQPASPDRGVTDAKQDKSVEPEILKLQARLQEITRPVFPEFIQHLQTGLDDKDNLNNWQQCARYITGEWLEQYIYGSLVRLREKNGGLGITDIVWDVNKEKMSGNSRARQFQVDVICMRGAQPFLFTCTTDRSIKTIKGKAFEALYRGEQFGGAHCKVVVVSMAKQEHNNMLAQDMQEFNARSKVSLLGIADIGKDQILGNLEKILKGVWRNGQDVSGII